MVVCITQLLSIQPPQSLFDVYHPHIVTDVYRSASISDTYVGIGGYLLTNISMVLLHHRAFVGVQIEEVSL